MRIASPIILTEQERTRLETLAAAVDTPARVAQRACIILLAAEGVQNKVIAPRLGIGRAQVARWRERYAHSGLDGILHDLPRGAPPVKVDVARLAMLTAADGAGEPRSRSVRTLATELGVSAASVSRHWRAAGLSTDDSPRTRYTPPAPFAGGAAEIIALHVAPPEHALVLAFGEQGGRDGPNAPNGPDGLDGLDGDVAMSPSIHPPAVRWRALAESLLTALRVLDGEVVRAPPGGSRHEHWLEFLRDMEAATPSDRHVWVLADNHACHQHADVQQWLRHHPRITVQLAPNSAGWLRMVHGFLRHIRVADARGGARLASGIPEALAAIETATRSRNATPFRWVRESAACRTAVAPPAFAEASQPMSPIASAKVLPPQGVRHLMPREALMGRLLQARRQRCVVIQGQAGSGKTSALMAWRKGMISLGYDVCWLSLSVEDNEPARFFDCLLASVAETDSVAASKIAQVVGAGYGYDEAAVELWVISLVQEIAGRQRELVLMIDDLHHISHPRILQALQLLLDYAPPQLHVALASRTALELVMERLRLQNLLAEFDMRDLRFSPEESARFLRDQIGSIAAGDAAALHTLTDGWVAGLQLLAIGLRKQQPGSYPATQVRDARAFASFFEREVLVQLAPDDLDILVRVAICQRFCAPLCAEILGQPQAVAQIKGRISRMVADHLFISVVGSHDHETWYRTHPLLRETLLGHLAARGDAAVRATHAAAWRWFEAHGHVDEAVLHAVSAGEPGAAASLVENCALMLLARGELNRVAGLVRLIPEEEVRQRYRLHGVMAYMQLYARDFDGLRPTLALLDAQRDAISASGRYSLCLLKTGMALQFDENDEAAALLDELWNPPADTVEFAWHARANILAWLLTHRGQHDLARSVLEEAGQCTRSRRSWLLGRCIHALSLAREGQIQQAGVGGAGGAGGSGASRAGLCAGGEHGSGPAGRHAVRTERDRRCLPVAGAALRHAGTRLAAGGCAARQPGAVERALAGRTRRAGAGLPRPARSICRPVLAGSLAGRSDGDAPAPTLAVRRDGAGRSCARARRRDGGAARRVRPGEMRTDCAGRSTREDRHGALYP